MRALQIIILAILTIFSSGCAMSHYYGPYYGKVVDRETKKPIEGAIVLAEYSTELYLSPGGPTSHYLNVRGVITNENGEFLIPSYHGIAFRPLSAFESFPFFSICMPQYVRYPNRYTKRIDFVPNYSLPEDHFVIIELQKQQGGIAQSMDTCNPIFEPTEIMRKELEASYRERHSRGLSPQ